jgi:uncharacterized protein
MAQPFATRASKPRFHPIVRVGLYLVALAVVATSLSLPALLLLRALAPLLTVSPLLLTPGYDDLGATVASFLVFLLATILVTWMFCRYVDRRPFVSLGLQRDRGWVRELVLGFGLGALLQTFIFALQLVSGAYQLASASSGSTFSGPLLIATMFIAFILVALNEELLARGYLLQTLAQTVGRPLAVVLSSGLFALGHLFNPNANAIALGALFFAGLLLAAGYLVSGRLWLPIGLHLSWNFFLGPVLGFPVSGLPTGGLLSPTPVGPQPLTGGEFGPEASLIALAAEGLGIALLWALRRRVNFPYALLPDTIPATTTNHQPSTHDS